MNFWKHDWNGDGKIDSWDDAFELYMVTQMVEEQEREDCSRIAEAARSRSRSAADRKTSGDTRGGKRKRQRG